MSVDGGGLKNDRKDGKVRMDLIVPILLHGVASILTFGAQKYGDRNWERGFNWSRPFGALMRHLWAWWGGEDFDAETGKSHLWHAGCCLMFLMHFEAHDVYERFDDRPVYEYEPDRLPSTDEEEAAERILEMMGEDGEIWDEEGNVINPGVVEPWERPPVLDFRGVDDEG